MCPLLLSFALSLSLSSRSALLTSVLDQGTPFSQWDSSTVVAWLELWVVVPFWYIAAIRSCLHSGEMLAVSEVGVVNGCGLNLTEKKDKDYCKEQNIDYVEWWLHSYRCMDV